jgi:hypothetical protein
MNILISFLLFTGLIVMLSFIGPQVYKVNKAFFKAGRIPIKQTLTSIGISILAILCYVVFAVLIFIFLG